MIAFPVLGSRPTVYRPSHRPSFRLRMFPSPFARLFGMVSAPFATNNTVTKATKLPESRTVIRKLSFEFGGTSLPYLCLWRRNFCVAGDVLLWLQRCDFRTAEQLFLLTTAAQNMRDPHRKFLSLGNHFFERLKTADSSTACGTSTLKSPLSRAFAVPHVHLRLRKRLSRCTLEAFYVGTGKAVWTG